MKYLNNLHIIIDWGGYSFSNLGDIAMLQVAVERIKSKFSDANIWIFTTNEEQLRKYFPGSQPIFTRTREIWRRTRLLPIPYRIIPKKIRKLVQNFESTYKYNHPKSAVIIMQITNFWKNSTDKQYLEFFEKINKSDFTIVSGGGFINDMFPEHTRNILSTLLIANKLQKPAGMFGQGIGPLNNQELIKLGKKTFPELKTIGIRESITSLQILKETGIKKEKIFVTGDDAIELVIQYPSVSIIQDCVGINIRLAKYAGNLEIYLDQIGNVISKIALENKLKIIPIPIHIGDDYRDIRASERTCLIDFEEIETAKKIDTVEHLILQINRCRIVITGSYHAAVFALSSGIPVVGIAESDYYKSKFLGLANQFSIGCEVVDLSEENPFENLKKSIQKSLDLNVKDQLIEKAMEQVNKSKQAWDYFFNLVA